MNRMMMRNRRAMLALATALAALWLAAAGSASAAPPAGHYTGTLADGATWIADVPTNWNGTLLLYSHGYGPLVAADAPDPTTQQALLNMGYAMAGSSYDPNGSWWALGSAVRDQFETLATVERSVLKTSPHRVYAFGTSMGGLISALEDQHSNRRLDGALTTCGIVGGGLNLNQYQLDGEYALSRLLAPGENIQLTHFTVGPPTFSDSAHSAAQLLAAAQAAQGTPQGQARLALAMAFLNVSPWGGPSIPNVYDYAGQQQGQYDDYFTGPFTAIAFIVEGRDQIEAAAGGESAGTVGVNFARLLYQSSYYPEVRALYNEAGLSLRADLANLTEHANLRPDRKAYRWILQTSTPNGRLQVPELDLKTISDQLVPVQQENYYRMLVDHAGDGALLRQAFVQAQGHCNFNSANLIAGLHALESRVNTGSWGNVATASQLNAAVSALPTNLDNGGGPFIPFWPDRLTAAVPIARAPYRWSGPPTSARSHRHSRRASQAVKARHRNALRRT
jgi:hypothetical protein